MVAAAVDTEREEERSVVVLNGVPHLASSMMRDCQVASLIFLVRWLFPSKSRSLRRALI